MKISQSFFRRVCLGLGLLPLLGAQYALGQPAAAVAPGAYQDLWIPAARKLAAEHPEYTGLTDFIDALDRMDTMSCIKEKRNIDKISQEGWRTSYPGVTGALQSQSAALEAAWKAAGAAPCPLPSTTEVMSPVPNFLKAQLICGLMQAEACRLEASGQPDVALHRAVLSWRFANRFSVSGVGLIHHMIAIGQRAASAKVIAMILRNPAFSADAAQKAGAALVDLEHARLTFADVTKSEISTCLAAQKAMRNNPAQIQQVIAQSPNLKDYYTDYFKNFDAIETEVNRALPLVLADLEKPFAQRTLRTRESLKTVTSNTYAQEMLASCVEEASVRADVELAYLRLCEALCALKMGKPEIAATFLDPFTGKPLVILPDRVYSLGPDGADQGGTQEYDSKQGGISAGDIFVLR